MVSLSELGLSFDPKGKEEKKQGDSGGGGNDKEKGKPVEKPVVWGAGGVKNSETLDKDGQLGR